MAASATTASLEQVYSYDAANRLRSLTAGGITRYYRYNSAGIRIGEQSGASNRRYLVDSNRDYAEVVQEWQGASLVASYVHGDELLAQQRGGQYAYPLHDGHGSVRALSSGSGSLTDSYDYDAFGVALAASGSSVNPYRYSGEWFDPNLEQYYLRARYYAPQIGRFSQMDSWQGNNHDPITLHKYAYGNADPVNGIDPSGNMTLGLVGVSLNIASNLYTAGSLTFNILTGNYGAAGVMAKEIAEEVVLSKLSYLRPVAKLSDEATALFGRVWSRTVKLKLGYERNSSVLRHNMKEILGEAPANHQAHHIVGGAYPEGKAATELLKAKGIDVNSVMNGVFWPGCGNKSGLGTIHCGKHTKAYEQHVLEQIEAVSHDRMAMINALNDIRMDLLSGSLRLNKH